MRFAGKLPTGNSSSMSTRRSTYMIDGLIRHPIIDGPYGSRVLRASSHLANSHKVSPCNGMSMRINMPERLRSSPHLSLALSLSLSTTSLVSVSSPVQELRSRLEEEEEESDVSSSSVSCVSSFSASSFFASRAIVSCSFEARKWRRTWGFSPWRSTSLLLACSRCVSPAPLCPHRGGIVLNAREKTEENIFRNLSVALNPSANFVTRWKNCL